MTLPLRARDPGRDCRDCSPPFGMDLRGVLLIRGASFGLCTCSGRRAGLQMPQRERAARLDLAQ